MAAQSRMSPLLMGRLRRIADMVMLLLGARNRAPMSGRWDGLPGRPGLLSGMCLGFAAYAVASAFDQSASSGSMRHSMSLATWSGQWCHSIDTANREDVAMNDRGGLAGGGRFEAERPRLRSVAYRMLGSLSEADDALQDAWIRVSRANADEVDNLGGWLTTIDRADLSQHAPDAKPPSGGFLEEHLPDPVISAEGEREPERQAITARTRSAWRCSSSSIPWRPLSDSPSSSTTCSSCRSTRSRRWSTAEATRQLASRARRRVKGGIARRGP